MSQSWVQRLGRPAEGEATEVREVRGEVDAAVQKSRKRTGRDAFFIFIVLSIAVFRELQICDTRRTRQTIVQIPWAGSLAVEPSAACRGEDGPSTRKPGRRKSQSLYSRCSMVPEAGNRAPGIDKLLLVVVEVSFKAQKSDLVCDGLASRSSDTRLDIVPVWIFENL
ncbi:hypothetical protein B0H14DRAFT_3018983 [Mycena olivaceomarginata]|nr:hypothetical protein B0H14DRAFT_3018983 [Mycena olivaceomarginata]